MHYFHLHKLEIFTVPFQKPPFLHCPRTLPLRLTCLHISKRGNASACCVHLLTKLWDFAFKTSKNVLEVKPQSHMTGWCPAPRDHPLHELLTIRYRMCSLNQIKSNHIWFDLIWFDLISSSSAIHQQSAIWTGAHASEVRWTFVLVCRTKSLEQSPVFTARTHRHQHFQTQTKDLSFPPGLSLNLCSSIRFVFISFYFILFYFSSRYVIRWSILFCKRNSLWTMNYEHLFATHTS